VIDQSDGTGILARIFGSGHCRMRGIIKRRHDASSGQSKIGRKTALLWGVLAVVFLVGALWIFAMNPVSGNGSLFGSSGSAVVVATALCITAAELVLALVPWPRPKGLRWCVSFPGILSASVLAAMSYGNLTSGLIFLLAPAAIGVYVVSIYVARKPQSS
jgi:hypothetical protein